MFLKADYVRNLHKRPTLFCLPLIEENFRFEQASETVEELSLSRPEKTRLQSEIAFMKLVHNIVESTGLCLNFFFLFYLGGCFALVHTHTLPLFPI